MRTAVQTAIAEIQALTADHQVEGLKRLSSGAYDFRPWHVQQLQSPNVPAEIRDTYPAKRTVEIVSEKSGTEKRAADSRGRDWKQITIEPGKTTIEYFLDNGAVHTQEVKTLKNAAGKEVTETLDKVSGDGTPTVETFQTTESVRKYTRTTHQNGDYHETGTSAHGVLYSMVGKEDGSSIKTYQTKDAWKFKYEVTEMVSAHKVGAPHRVTVKGNNRFNPFQYEGTGRSDGKSFGTITWTNTGYQKSAICDDCRLTCK